MWHSDGPFRGVLSLSLFAISLLSFVLLGTSCHSAQPSENNAFGAAANVNGQSPAALDTQSAAPIVIDMHADTPQLMVDQKVDLTVRLATGQVDAVRAREGRLTAQFFSIWVEPQLFGARGPKAIRRADQQIAAVRELTERHPETWQLATSVADLRRIAAEGKLAALLGLEGGYAIDERLENVERYYRLGVRYMSPTWSVSLSWAGSSGDEAGKTRGLNQFGKQVVLEMNRLGMLVDVSHVSDKTFWDIVNSSRQPVIASHSACRAIANVARNLDDEMIRAIARTHGVVCVIFYPEFLEPGWSQKREAVDREIAPLVQQASDAEQGDAVQKKLARDRIRWREYKSRLPAVSVTRLVDHIDHIVKLVGMDYVGIGSDFDGVQAALTDLASAADLPNLSRELLRRGYSPADVNKILGGNVLRVLAEIEKR